MSRIHDELEKISSTEPAQAQPAFVVPGAVGAKKRASRLPKRTAIIGGLLSLAVAGAVGRIVYSTILKAPAHAAKGTTDGNKHFDVTALLQQGRAGEALDRLRDIIKAEPENTAALINLALAYSMIPDLKAAKENLEKALAIDPNEKIVHNNLGRLSAISQDWPAAIESYKKALAIDANYRDALFNLATAFEMTSDWDQSVQNYERFLAALEGNEKELRASVESRVRRLRAFRSYTLNKGEKK